MCVFSLWLLGLASLCQGQIPRTVWCWSGADVTKTRALIPLPPISRVLPSLDPRGADLGPGLVPGAPCARGSRCCHVPWDLREKHSCSPAFSVTPDKTYPYSIPPPPPKTAGPKLVNQSFSIFSSGRSSVSDTLEQVDVVFVIIYIFNFGERY